MADVQLHGFFAASPRSHLLRPVEHVKEHSDSEAAERIDERREQHCRRNQTPQGIERR